METTRGGDRFVGVGEVDAIDVAPVGSQDHVERLRGVPDSVLQADAQGLEQQRLIGAREGKTAAQRAVVVIRLDDIGGKLQL